MKDNFILNSPLAKEIYLEIKDLPIIDYHNHLAIGDVISDRRFDSITELWISPDPYKHRAMRILGVPERLITGDGGAFEKFDAWCGCLRELIGNPLYDWSVMEMDTVFGIDLNPEKIDTGALFSELNEKLKNLTAKKILDKFNIEYSAPCATVKDDISVYNSLKTFAPSLRGDDIPSPQRELIKSLSDLTGISIKSTSDYLRAIDKRLCDFKAVGAAYADHALDDGFTYVNDDGKNEERFNAILSGISLSDLDKQSLYSYLLKESACLYAKHGFTMQLHVGAKRTTSDRLRAIAGPAGGYAAIGNSVSVKSLTELLNDVEKGDFGLPKTLLFTLNPADNEIMANLSGSYSKDGVMAVVSQGPAWWWCDHYKGMYDMLGSFSVHSVLSTFIGMTTDSRSLTSFVRHDYFRRVLSVFLADGAASGRLPGDKAPLIRLAKKLSYENAKKTVKV